MSLHLEFEPHSYYMGFAIKKDKEYWDSFILDGMKGYVVDLQAHTLKRLKSKIRKYHLRKHTGYGERLAKKRLNYLRSEIEQERISYGEIVELQGLASYIDNDDFTLQEWATRKQW